MWSAALARSWALNTVSLITSSGYGFERNRRGGLAANNNPAAVLDIRYPVWRNVGKAVSNRIANIPNGLYIVIIQLCNCVHYGLAADQPDGGGGIRNLLRREEAGT